ncbi:TIM barrel domain-containing protein [Elsinoe australis]|uniref:TIM barrel domain-containing protein n=1 Tax=Elsinoe australis TaxID=40998 RepID=A0A4U7B7M8_9PEZI|nr:TIM barrel domain-containing protein [Elsinoe australis]
MLFQMSTSRALCLLAYGLLSLPDIVTAAAIAKPIGRERININADWKFLRSETNPDGIIYDQRPDLVNLTDATILKPWVLPSGNDFISDPAGRYERPAGNPGGNLSYVQSSFDDSSWETVTLPHDWAIKGPFYVGDPVPVGGGMGRLPVQGVGWYRQTLSKVAADEGRNIYLEVEGAMSYAMVWLNGNLVGGWPYGYNSFRLDLTDYLHQGDDNQLAIRLDNPVDSARWYPGGGLYRNVFLTKVDPIHVGQWGTFVTTREVSAESATIDLTVQVENAANMERSVDVMTDIYTFDSAIGDLGEKVAECSRSTVQVSRGQKQSTNASITIQNPRLWGPPPVQEPHLYAAVTRLFASGKEIDSYQTQFGIRSLIFDPNNGLQVNGQRVQIQGVNEHHDLGAIGAAFNVRAAERKLEILADMGCNAIRMSHNPPATELLELTDRFGFLVLDEIFDSWERNKTANDFHLIFPDWHEQDLRAMLRRDRNHPSIVAWSYGNEVGEQMTGDAGAALLQTLVDILHSEDTTRPASASMNFAMPNMSFPRVLDIINLNYQGSGIRDTNPYSNLQGIIRSPQYPPYHEAFPNKLILSSESASTLSTRGTFIYPVTPAISAPSNDTSGSNSTALTVSSYDLYTAGFGSSPDKVFLRQDASPFVAGEFVWTGFDYLGEPTPYYTARSSYSGIIDLAGFPKDRYYIYQARWRPELKMTHILPHWNWVGQREGLVTPVHVYSAADEAELWVNGVSQGRKKRGADEYRFRWDEVVYQPGEVRVQTWKNGEEWADAEVRTTGPAAGLKLSVYKDGQGIKGDGVDLGYVTVEVIDAEGQRVPDASNEVTFEVDGAELVATDNGDPADLRAFPEASRNAYSGLALAIVRASKAGIVTFRVSAEGLEGTEVTVQVS